MYSAPATNMVDVYVEQPLIQSTGDWIDCRTIEESVTCLDINRVRFVDATLSRSGDRVICHFLAPDIESVRRVIRRAGICADSIWAETAAAAQRTDGNE